MYGQLKLAHQVERMDYTPYTILRPSSKFAVDIHRMGHWWASFSSPCRRFYLQVVWKEMVNI